MLPALPLRPGSPTDKSSDGRITGLAEPNLTQVLLVLAPATGAHHSGVGVRVRDVNNWAGRVPLVQNTNTRFSWETATANLATC